MLRPPELVRELAAEHQAVRERVGLFDQSSFAKFVLKGRDRRRCSDGSAPMTSTCRSARPSIRSGSNERGGIEADLTVTREAEDAFLIVTSCATQTRDFTWLCRSIPDEARAVAFDVSSAYAVLGLMGPRSRELLTTLTDADLSTAAFPFATSQIIDLATRAYGQPDYLRGRAGYELYIPTEFAQSVYDVIVGRAGPLGCASRATTP